MIGIICAMDSEVTHIYELIENPVITELYGYKFVSGTLQGKEVVAMKCGVGKVNAAMGAQTMIMKFAPELVINSGVAGSLSGELNICDIAVGTDVVQHDFDCTAAGDPLGLFYPCDENVAQAICDGAKAAGVNAVKARIASGDQFISDGAKKRWIVENFAAKACEMEAGAISQVCALTGVKCAVIRAISDSTDGDHAMEFYKFVQIAADNSVKVLLETLKRI